MRLHLQPKQWRLFQLLTASGPTVPTVLGGGGAKGGGKSAGARNIALLLATELADQYPGVVITIVRRVARHLLDNHITPLKRQHPELLKYWRASDNALVLPNAMILFRSAETTGDVEKQFTGGFESAFMIVDEAQQFSESELQAMQMAARWTDSARPVPANLAKTLLLFNPGGIGGPYIRRIFWSKEYELREKPTNYSFVHVFGWDNFEWFRGQTELTEDQFYELDSQTRFQMFIRDTSEGRKYDAFPESIREGYLLGNFDHFENQYFAGAWKAEKCVIPTSIVDRLVKPWWVRWMAQDWGFGDHDAHGWFAVGKVSPSEWMSLFGGETEYPMDVVVLYRENIINNRAEADLAMDIVAKTPDDERGRIEKFFLSQDAFGTKARSQGANSVGEQFNKIMQRYGMPSPQPADQERVTGWRFMYNCLRQANLRGTIFGEERSLQGPALFVSAECPNTISCIPMAIRAEDDPDDVERVPGVLWEDVTDMIRYGLKSYLEPMFRAPVEVRRREVYDTYNAEERTTEQMTALGMAMRKFDADERGRYKRVKRRM